MNISNILSNLVETFNPQKILDNVFKEEPDNNISNTYRADTVSLSNNQSGTVPHKSQNEKPSFFDRPDVRLTATVLASTAALGVVGAGIGLAIGGNVAVGAAIGAAVGFLAPVVMLAFAIHAFT